MIKIVALIKRRPDLSLAEFCDHYEHRHQPLFAREVPPEVSEAIVHYVQNHALALGEGRREASFDCVTEIGFRDMAGVKRWTDWYRGDAGKVLRDDEEQFMDVPRKVVVLTEERNLGTGA